MLVPKLLLTPIKIRIFGPKTAKIGPKSAFLVIFTNSGVGVDFLARRPTFFLNDRNLETKSQKIVPKVGNEPLVARWLVGWWMWRAGCISQDTYLLYFILKLITNSFEQS